MLLLAALQLGGRRFVQILVEAFGCLSGREFLLPCCAPRTIFGPTDHAIGFLRPSG